MDTSKLQTNDRMEEEREEVKKKKIDVAVKNLNKIYNIAKLLSLSL